MWKGRLLFAALAAIVWTTALADDGSGQGPLRLSIALKGLGKPCCDEAVQKALSGIPGVQAVRIEETLDGKSAVIAVEKTASPRLAAISTALEGAAKEMRGKGMEVQYEIDRERFQLTDGAILVVSSMDSTPTLETSLIVRLRGLNGVSVESREGVLYARLRMAPSASVQFLDAVQAVEGAGGQVTDVALAPVVPVAAKAPTAAPQPAAQTPADPPRPRGGSC